MNILDLIYLSSCQVGIQPGPALSCPVPILRQHAHPIDPELALPFSFSRGCARAEHCRADQIRADLPACPP